MKCRTTIYCINTVYILLLILGHKIIKFQVTADNKQCSFCQLICISVRLCPTFDQKGKFSRNCKYELLSMRGQSSHQCYFQKRTSSLHQTLFNKRGIFEFCLSLTIKFLKMPPDFLRKIQRLSTVFEVLIDMFDNHLSYLGKI